MVVIEYHPSLFDLWSLDLLKEYLPESDYTYACEAPLPFPLLLVYLKG